MKFAVLVFCQAVTNTEIMLSGGFYLLSNNAQQGDFQRVKTSVRARNITDSSRPTHVARSNEKLSTHGVTSEGEND